MFAIETLKLCKNYGKARGIVDLNLEVRPGEIFGFIGPNGAGKSTTIRTLLGFLHPTGGKALVFGRDCESESALIKREVGYMPSEAFFYDDMRVGQLLAYAASFHGGGWEGRILELCRILELDSGMRIEELSYGNRKKVSIVQALLHGPRLLVLDEPTGGLDPLIQQRFFGLLEEERSKGTTIFFSSHVLSEVQRLCDRVAIIREGRMLKVEGMAELRANRYKRVRVELGSASADGGTADADKLRRLPGAGKLAFTGRSCEFLYAGRIDELTRSLGSMELENLSIEEPSLEEIFLHYYEEGGKTA